MPIKADFPLPRIPYMTVVVCLLCALVFTKQLGDWEDFELAIQRYCNVDHSRIKQMVFAQIDELNDIEHCAEIMYSLSNSDDQAKAIQDLVMELKPLVGYDYQESMEYVTFMLQDELQRYDTMVPPNPDHGLAYNTASWNPWHMITSTFAHGDWGHIIFNLIFFFAFAATVEILIGPMAFSGSIISIGLFTGVFSSVSAMATGNDFYTLGLSGVVMGMMGLYSFLLPKGNIKCFYFFFVIFGTVAVPAWALTLWYVGGDIFRLFAFEDNGFVNVMAHVSGGLAGYLFGVAFMRKAKNAAHDTVNVHA